MKCTEKGYINYKNPKKGVFSVPKKNGKYLLGSGWETVEEDVLIIGEDDQLYVYELKESVQGYYFGKKVVTKKYVIPIGIHKSRLIRWHSCQLELFN